MVQGSPCGSERFWDSLQDHGWGSLLSVFHPSGNKQDVPRFEEEFLVDKNEARNSKICDWMWHMSGSHGWSFETCQKSATLGYSQLEMVKHMYILYCGFTAHLAQV
jgi:hypothetical protein